MANRGCSLLVRNLRYETSPEKVRAIFEKVGRVKDVYLPIDHTTREPRGFGFVEYFDEKDAQEAVREFDRYALDGNEISVIIAQDRRKSPHTMRKIIAERQNGKHYRGSPMNGRGPSGREGEYTRGRYEARPGRYERDRGGPYEGSYRMSGDSYGRRGRGGYEDDNGGSDDRRYEYRGGDDHQRRVRGGRSRSRSRPYEDMRGERHRYPPEEARNSRGYERSRHDDHARGPP
ncbi:hypothetical protein Emag_005747 [Eimeria magna]